MENFQPYTDQQLKKSLWYVEHKLILKNIFVGVLFFINLAVWGYVLASLVFNYGVNYESYQDLKYGLVVDETVNEEVLIEKTRPRNIAIQKISSLPSADNRQDALALIRNPNEFWSATFSYRFVGDKANFETRSGFILPGQEKYLYDLDVDVNTVNDIAITDVLWTRVNNFAELQKAHEQLTFKEVKMTTPSEEQPTTQVTFIIENNTIYNYFEPSFLVTLQRSGELVAAQAITIDSLRSGQSRPIDVRWVENVPLTQDVGVFADINYLSKDAFLAQ